MEEGLEHGIEPASLCWNSWNLKHGIGTDWGCPLQKTSIFPNSSLRSQRIRVTNLSIGTGDCSIASLGSMHVLNAMITYSTYPVAIRLRLEHDFKCPKSYC